MEINPTPTERFEAEELVADWYNTHGEEGYVVFYEAGSIRDYLTGRAGANISNLLNEGDGCASTWAVLLAESSNGGLEDAVLAANAKGVKFKYVRTLGQA